MIPSGVVTANGVPRLSKPGMANIGNVMIP